MLLSRLPESNRICGINCFFSILYKEFLYNQTGLTCTWCSFHVYFLPSVEEIKQFCQQKKPFIPVLKREHNHSESINLHVN